MNTQAQQPPRWNLSAIYPSTSSTEYKNAVSELDSLQKELTLFFDSPLLQSDFPQWLNQFVEKSNRLYSLFVSLHAFAYASYSVDTTNPQLVNNLSMIEEKSIGIEQVELSFSTTFAHTVEQNPQILNDVFTRFPHLSQYEYLFAENILFSKHQMSNELESLASTLGLTGGESWSRLQEQIISNMADGESGKTFNELRNDAYNSCRAIRETSYKKELALLTSSRIPLAACLNSIKGATVALNKRRLWQNTLEKSCAQSRLSKKTLDSLIASIEESLPLWHRYLRAKARILFPTDSNPRLAFYDLFAPLTQNEATAYASTFVTNTPVGIGTAETATTKNSATTCTDSACMEKNARDTKKTAATTANTPATTANMSAATATTPNSASKTAADTEFLYNNEPSSQSAISKTWTFTEAKDYVIARFASFSADMGSFAQKAFDEHWVDAQVQSGKVGGAYCEDFPAHGVSRVLTNFTGAFSDITTLAHELGHAYHFNCVKDLDFSLTQYPMTLAETASNFAETIVQKDIIARSNGFDKISMIEMHLQDSCQVLVDILSRFYFERAVFEKRSEGELTADDFCALMTDAQDKTYGDAVFPKHPYMWALKSHYYSPNLDFYNFPYAFGMLFASGLYARYQNEGKTFAETYKSLLRDTGRLSCEEVCKNAGFDIESKEFWKSGIAQLEQEVSELEKFARVVQEFAVNGNNSNAAENARAVNDCGATGCELSPKTNSNKDSDSPKNGDSAS